MRNRFIALSAALLMAASPPLPGTRPPQAAPASGPPKLLVVIAIDQFSSDLFDEYRPQLGGGLARIASGIAYRNGYQSHAATETCPGHSTILTGDHPARTGVIENSWIDQSISRADKNVYCAEDESVPGSTSSAYTVSARHLLVPTLGELLKMRWPASRTVAVAGKDRAAVMMSGQKPDQRWYWTGTKFETDLKSAAIPSVIAKVNAAVAAGLAQSRPPLEPTAFCAGKSTPIALSGGKTVGAGRLARAAGDRDGFEASPEFDGDTLALAAGLIDELRLGHGPAPDLLAVGLSATDYVGHTYGTEGEEMCLQLTELDREIGDFLAVLDSRGIDYSVVLTADHGGNDLPERERLKGLSDAARIDPTLRSPPGLLRGPKGDIYVDWEIPAVDRPKLLDRAAGQLRANPQVEAVFTSNEIKSTPIPNKSPDQLSLIERVRENYYPARSGDLYVVLKKDITPIATARGSVATHGSPWDYDRRVPILFWRPGMAALPVERPVETVDIMPTLAAQIGLPIPKSSVDGKCLTEVTICPAP